MEPQRCRPSDVWNAAADEMLDAADMASTSAQHYAKIDLPVKALAERRAEELARMQAKRFRERARITRGHEDARAREDAIDQDATTGKYVVTWARERWWHRLARVFRG